MKKKIQVDNKIFEIEIKDQGNKKNVKVNDKNYKLDISTKAVNGFKSLLIDGENYEVFCEVKDEAHYILWIGHKGYEVRIGEALITADEAEGVSEITAPMPGLVADIKVKENDKISKGDPILILEAMKMQNEIKSPKDGVVKEILTKEGTKVALQQKLVVLE
jgi:biotin carboxyl carrier protein